MADRLPDPEAHTALYTGLRLGELLGLQWRDIDLHESVLHVRKQWTRAGEYGPTKSDAGVRRLPLSADMVKYLAALKLNSHYSGDDDPVFASKNGKPLAIATSPVEAQSPRSSSPGSRASASTISVTRSLRG